MTTDERKALLASSILQAEQATTAQACQDACDTAYHMVDMLREYAIEPWEISNVNRRLCSALDKHYVSR